MPATEAVPDLHTTTLRVIESLSAGLPLIALAADVLAADARFNHWVATQAKGRLDEDAMLELVDLYEGVSNDCRRGVDEFERTNDEGALSAVLTAALGKLQTATRNGQRV